MDDHYDRGDFDKWKYCSDEERALFEQEGIREFNETEQEQREFLTVSFVALKTEIACIEQHAIDNEWEQIIWHLDSMTYGLRLMFNGILGHIIPPDNRGRLMAELTASKMTRDSGVPHKATYVPQVSGWAVVVESTVVPDNVDEIIAMMGEIGNTEGDRRDMDDGGH